MALISNWWPFADVDECAANMCRNAETCDNTAGNYTCHCIRGFSGRNCQTNLNDCHGQCLNGATCIDLIDQYHCACQPGFSGNYSQFDNRPQRSSMQIVHLFIRRDWKRNFDFQHSVQVAPARLIQMPTNQCNQLNQLASRSWHDQHPTGWKSKPHFKLYLT